MALTAERLARYDARMAGNRIPAVKMFRVSRQTVLRILPSGGRRRKGKAPTDKHLITVLRAVAEHEYRPNEPRWFLLMTAANRIEDLASSLSQATSNADPAPSTGT